MLGSSAGFPSQTLESAILRLQEFSTRLGMSDKEVGGSAKA